MSEETIKVPDIGDVSDVEVIEVCVSPGDQVEKDDTLIVLESDKASMEVPSPRAGKVASISVQVGNKVSQGDEILVMSGASEADKAPEKSEERPQEKAAPQGDNNNAQAGEKPAQAVAGGADLDVAVPDIGDAQGVEVIEIPVKVGDSVAQDDTLIVLESDKASMEIPAPQPGVVSAIHVALGDKVSQGNLIVTLTTDAAASLPQESPAAENPGAEDSPDAAPQPADSTPASSEAVITGELILEVPDIGDAGAVEVIEIAVQAGDKVEIDDTIAVLESDKASMEVPATHAGTVKKVLLKVGQKVEKGSPMVSLETFSSQTPVDFASDSQPEVAQSKVGEDVVAKPPSPAPVETSPAQSGELIYAGPAVRLLAREFGVDLSKVSPTGPRGRILKEDVQTFVKKALSGGAGVAAAQGAAIPPVPEVDFSQFGKVENVPMSRVKKLTAAAMHRSWLNVPHVTHFDEADITDLEEFRAQKKSQAQERGLKLTPLPFLLKACAAALKEYPQFNVSLAASGEELIQKFYYNIGIAMDTPAGLMVPVIREVDKKGIWELAEEAARLGVKGQEGKLSRDDMQGGCFTISSLGAIGGTGFTPIVNTPEVAILGVSKTLVKPAYLNHEFVPRSMLPLALSYDHRAINGVDAGRFMTFLTQVLSDIRKLVL